MSFGFTKDTAGLAAAGFALMAPLLVLGLVWASDYGLYLHAAKRLDATAQIAAKYLNDGGDEDYLAEDVYIPGNPDMPRDALNSLTANVEYVCECPDTKGAECDPACVDNAGNNGNVDENKDEEDEEIADEEIQSSPNDEGNTYIHHYLEVTLSMSRRPLINLPGIMKTQTVTGFAKLRVE